MRLAPSFGIVLCSLLLATSCGDGGDDPDDASSGSADSSATSEPSESESAEPKSKKELKAIKEKKAKKAAKAAGSEPPSTGDTGADPAAADIEAAAQTYSDAFLTGDSAVAFDLLSTRCQDELRDDFGTLVAQADAKYGEMLPFESFDVEVTGDTASATYTFSAKKLNRDSEQWVLQEDRWKQDDC